MEIWQAIVLGMVQGFAEFLPISSSGHLILLQHWFGVEKGVIFFTVILHLGTLVPIVIVLYKEILALFKKPFTGVRNLLIATLPAGLVGVIFALAFDLDSLFTENIWLLGVSFLFTAGEMLFSEIRSKKTPLNNAITLKSSIIMGCGQAVGVFPGISRSGSTVTAGTIAGVEKEKNASFTFLMSIPIILAAVLLQTIDGAFGGSFGTIGVLPLFFGFITATLTGYISITFMMKVIKKANYKWFSLYLILLSIATFITALINK